MLTIFAGLEDDCEKGEEEAPSVYTTLKNLLSASLRPQELSVGVIGQWYDQLRGYFQSAEKEISLDIDESTVTPEDLEGYAVLIEKEWNWIIREEVQRSEAIPAGLPDLMKTIVATSSEERNAAVTQLMTIL